MEDEYVLKKYSDGYGACFFYKNGLLHREAGPAYISEEEIEDNPSLLNIGDEHLYKEEIYKTRQPEGFNETIVFEKNYFNIRLHYLSGIPYSNEEFKIIKEKMDLQKELSNSLDKSQLINTKKIKI